MIIGYTALASAHVNEAQEVKKYLSKIETASNHLLLLINDVLDMSKIEAGKTVFKYSDFSILDLVQELNTIFHSQIYEKQQTLTIIKENIQHEWVNGDQVHLIQIFSNLLSNAVKFTNEGSVTFGCRRREYGLYFYVSDTGCGIAPEDQKSIFNRFVKLDAYVQGTGLGLALCKSIVKHLGGKIGVTSEKGKGSTFWFVLPNVQ